MSANSITKTTSNRLPAPALFVGPPSRNASNTSLIPSTEGKPTRTPLTRQRSLLGPDSKRPLPPSHTDTDNLSPISSNPSAPFIRRQNQQNQAADAEASSRAEAIWAEMQNTLEEVELSAIKGPGMTVFGSEHSRALDELRRAQIELAKAWARSEAEEEGQGVEERKLAKGTDAADMLATDRAQKLGGSQGGPGSVGSGIGGTFERSRLEEETEKDIELSRKRREANDRYFEKVNKGVLDVVMKLEEVAGAMKDVEVESKEIWGDGESVDTASLTTVPSVT
ncbi:uncharacterized protein BDR25DRAFT_345213 [Lindgomyces ingoldianus]|uniref:Uncharacterized protein n=1 Tax=Lindgomyces ingoldianus TaxID=673940 RepID=A0ACB6QJD7_9PLEO|nr:uncharacterized protein BDR25DRAFT_345213 [Lindgomyces ingoldianus]KAF2467043.1 hypothetical protein BDR25DRAFT_345213 [Lindgomyces ingoldianus]